MEERKPRSTKQQQLIDAVKRQIEMNDAHNLGWVTAWKDDVKMDKADMMLLTMAIKARQASSKAIFELLRESADTQ